MVSWRAKPDLTGARCGHPIGIGSEFVPTPVARLAEVKLAGKQEATVKVSGEDGLPSSGISAADVNLQASGVTGVGSVVAYADGQARPGTTNISYTPGITSSGAALTPVGADGDIDLYNAGGDPVTVFVDLVGGYYQP